LSYMPILISLLVPGLLLIAAGTVLKVHPHQFRFLNIKDGLTLEGIAGRKTIEPILSFLSGNKRSRRYRFSQRMIARSETEMSVQALYLLKLVSVAAVTVIAFLVSFTNADVLKLSIMSKPQEGFQIFQDISIQDYSRNATLYKAVVTRIGEDTLKKLDRVGKTYLNSLEAFETLRQLILSKKWPKPPSLTGSIWRTAESFSKQKRNKHWRC